MAAIHSSGHVMFALGAEGTLPEAPLSFTSAGPQHHYALYSSQRCRWNRTPSAGHTRDRLPCCAPSGLALPYVRGFHPLLLPSTSTPTSPGPRYSD